MLRVLNSMRYDLKKRSYMIETYLTLQVEFVVCFVFKIMISTMESSFYPEIFELRSLSGLLNMIVWHLICQASMTFYGQFFFFL